MPKKALGRLVPTVEIDEIKFGFFSPEGRKALSIKELTATRTFDQLGHPTVDGLQDPALGPNGERDLCTTCRFTHTRCPGHLGLIRFPLFVYNPVSFRILLLLLKGACLECDVLCLQPATDVIILSQLKAINSGNMSLAWRIDELGNSALLADDVQKIEIIHEIHRLVKDELSDSSSKILNKNMQQDGSRIVKDFLMGKFFLKKCSKCKHSKRPVSHQDMTTIYCTRPSSQQFGGNEDNDKKEKADKVKSNKTKARQPRKVEKFILSPNKIREHMLTIWKNHKSLLDILFPQPTDNPEEMFFLSSISVPPNCFRPMSFMQGKHFEHHHTFALGKLLQSSEKLKQILITSKIKLEDADTPVNLETYQDDDADMNKLYHEWVQLQFCVNGLFDSETDKAQLLGGSDRQGLRQVIEKKSGLFRKFMMGKRVNFAARSVISPDPFIATDEIGVPMVFAKNLTYPQTVTPWNFHQLRQAVVNGPGIHPGANFVEYEDGTLVCLSANNHDQRQSIAKQLLTPSTKNIYHGKRVYRHLINGDHMLLNRQPTLHRPSLQAHRARVLPGERTLRLHYANCKAYNADFDGDEMNAHLPQDERSRAECRELASARHQYLGPKDGAPLAGLIQDHVVSGVLLTIRGRFFAEREYHQLLFASLPQFPARFRLLPPAIVKPRRLWSGKQIVSTLILNLSPPGRRLLNLDSKAKISDKTWQRRVPRMPAGGSLPSDGDMSESQVVFRAGQLLVGVLDKAHFGNSAFGMVHCCYELYGPSMASRMLTCLSRLFTTFLQGHGFSLGVEDILCTAMAENKRNRSVLMGRAGGDRIAKRALGRIDLDGESLKRELQRSQFSADSDLLRKEQDLAMKGHTDSVQNSIAKIVMPLGLLKPFPLNSLQLMVQSGAKGSLVNCMQISALLGQIELEGQRPPLMLNGQSLPSFRSYDTSARAGAFIDGRFLTGIQKQEYFFHCMAGREGLVDTAVKTSRSGYLQRCLVKHLEGISVQYDYTVRDSDGSVIQFLYGEDGLDVCRVGLLSPQQFPFLKKNCRIFLKASKLNRKKFFVPELGSAWEKVRNYDREMSSPFLKYSKRKFPKTVDYGEQHNGRLMANLNLVNKWRSGKSRPMAERQLDPIISKFPPSRSFGSISERLKGQLDDCGEKLQCIVTSLHMNALSPPGEPVGLIAAQSIGEPSTQMTLNTFHFAGRGEMNVTLGIPRLREILMVPGTSVKTPSMDVNILPHVTMTRAAMLKVKFDKVLLSQVLQSITVRESFQMIKNNRRQICQIKFSILSPEMYESDCFVTPSTILGFIENKFFREFLTKLKLKRKNIDTTQLLNGQMRFKQSRSKKNENDSEQEVGVDGRDEETETAVEKALKVQDADSSEDSDIDGEDNAINQAQRRKLNDEQEYDDDDDDDSDEEEKQENEVSGDENGLLNETDSEMKMCLSLGDELDKKRKKVRIDKARVKKVMSILQSEVEKVVSYQYDDEEESWCEIVFQFSCFSHYVNLSSLLTELTEKSVIHQITNIKRAFLVNDPGRPMSLKTDGVNFKEIYRHAQYFDVNTLYSNDILAIFKSYGIEAARQAIVKEISHVFGAYGIKVDYRHLALIADYLTFDGSLISFNRHGILANSSPFQKLTFETSMQFLKMAALTSSVDALRSPSACLAVGKTVQCGTGMVEDYIRV